MCRDCREYLPGCKYKYVFNHIDKQKNKNEKIEQSIEDAQNILYKSKFITQSSNLMAFNISYSVITKTSNRNGRVCIFNNTRMDIGSVVYTTLQLYTHGWGP